MPDDTVAHEQPSDNARIRTDQNLPPLTEPGTYLTILPHESANRGKTYEDVEPKGNDQTTSASITKQSSTDGYSYVEKELEDNLFQSPEYQYVVESPVHRRDSYDQINTGVKTQSCTSGNSDHCIRGMYKEKANGFGEYQGLEGNREHASPAVYQRLKPVPK